VPEAVVYYQPVATYDELRSAYLRSTHTHSRARLAANWAEPLPRGVVCRAVPASFRRQPLNGVAWLALRARLWSERSRGLLRPYKGFTSSGVWDKLPQDSPLSRPGSSHHHTSEEPAGRPA
jgi:hypothetical protein